MGSRLVVTGTGDGNFSPDRNITRAEFVTILVKGLGLMRNGTGKDTFNDVLDNTWYYDAVSIAYEYGLISGVGNDKFKPMDLITREEAMTIVKKAMNITELKFELSDDEENKILENFSDSLQSSDWANESIAACVKTGIIEGRGSQTLAPKDQLTRAEATVIVQKLLQKSKLI